MTAPKMSDPFRAPLTVFKPSWDVAIIMSGEATVATVNIHHDVDEYTEDEYSSDMVNRAEAIVRAVNEYDSDKETIAKLAEALRPLGSLNIERATVWAEANEPWPDTRVLVGYDGVEFTVGMVRAARAALALSEGRS